MRGSRNAPRLVFSTFESIILQLIEVVYIHNDNFGGVALEDRPEGTLSVADFLTFSRDLTAFGASPANTFRVSNTGLGFGLLFEQSNTFDDVLLQHGL